MKTLLVLTVFFIGITFLPASIAQESIRAIHESIEVTISRDGNVDVTHEIFRDPFRTVTVELLEGTISELQVTYENGDSVDYSFEGNVISIIQPGQSVTVKYNLQDALKEVNGYWRMVVNYPNTILFNLPEEVDMIFANERAIILNGSTMNCHGCGVTIEYVFDEPKTLQNVLWEEKEFDVEINTLSNISSFVFDQPSKRISFDVESGKFVTVIIPLELLWEPYEVLLDDKKILKHKFYNDGTNAWLSFRPYSSGTIDIIGTSVVPEFSVLLPIMLVSISMVILLQFRNKAILR